MLPLILLGVLFASVFIYNVVKILDEYERGVVFRLGRLVSRPRGPGLILLIPFIEKMRRLDTRTLTLDVPSQDVITKDNVSVKVNAVIYFRVIDVNKAVVEVENYYYATSQLSQTTLRSVCGESDLDDLLTNRETINERLQEILDRETDPWGVKVSKVELKHIDLPIEMQRAMAKQAEAERERRAKVIAALGEYQAAQKLSEAAHVMAKEPQALQLRYLQTLSDIAVENSSTVIFPVPIEFMNAFAPRTNKPSE